MDDLGLGQAVDRLGEDIVVTVVDAADRGLVPGLGKQLPHNLNQMPNQSLFGNNA